MFHVPFRLPLRVALLAGLAAALVLAPTQGEAQAKKKKPQRDLVTRDEILDTGQGESDLFTVLRNVRPRFLEPPTGIRTLGGNAMVTSDAEITDAEGVHVVTATSVLLVGEGDR